MEKKKSSRLVILSLLLVVSLSAYLRLTGITWGMNSGYDHYLNFHPDEFISIQGMLPISLLAGKLQAPSAYFEGTFNYYLWAVPEMLYELCGGACPIVGQNLPAGQFKFILLSGRLMSVAFDLTTLVLLFAVIREITGQPLGAFFGAFLYGVFPMQVIYSHFMRTYALSNLLCVLVIWLSLKALKRRRWLLFVITGVAAGLAATTRYSTAIVLSIPCLFILFQNYGNREPWLQRFGKSTAYLLTGPLWLLAGGFVLGVFAGEPMLIFDFKRVVEAVSFEMSHYAPPGARNPFDLAPIWRYLSVLIPHATYPLLWVLIYLSTLYVILRPSFWPIVVPLCLFAALYTYSMAKNYMDLFARLVMLLLPVFCIFAGMAFGDILSKLFKRRLLFALVMILILLLIMPTILFDWAYGRAMRGRDVREMLRNDMGELIKDRSSTSIAVSEGGYYFYTAMPAVLPLKSNNVAVQLESSLTAQADFFVMGFGWPLAENSLNSTIRQVESGGPFRFMKAYSRAPSVLGKRLDLSNFPPDMTYPFPTILLFRRLTTP
jgi:hypothetical protein